MRRPNSVTPTLGRQIGATGRRHAATQNYVRCARPFPRPVRARGFGCMRERPAAGAHPLVAPTVVRRLEGDLRLCDVGGHYPAARSPVEVVTALGPVSPEGLGCVRGVSRPGTLWRSGSGAYRGSRLGTGRRSNLVPARFRRGCPLDTGSVGCAPSSRVPSVPRGSAGRGQR